MTPPSISRTVKKRDLKEKIVLIYENLLKHQAKSNLVVDLVNNEAYWDEFFLLRANPKAMIDLLVELNYEELIESKNLINLLFTQSAITLNCDNYIRKANALVTLLTLSRTILGSTKIKVENQLDILIGKSDLKAKIDLVSSKLYALLVAENPQSIKLLVLKLYITFLTGYDDIKSNPFAENFMSDKLFDAFMSILASPAARQAYGYQTLLLITILINHRKNKIVNPFTVRLSIVDNEVVLNGYAQVISHSFIEFIKKFYDTKEENTNTGLLSSLTSMVGNMFVPEEETVDNIGLEPDDGILMGYYGIVHLNRNFITQLAHISAECYSDSGSSNLSYGNNSSTNELSIPSNLLVIFFEFCSIVMLQTKDEENFDTSRLCLLILTCISEDQCANAIMHDLNIVYKVNLHRLPMRHRKVADEGNKLSRPLAYSVLDLMVEFISTHLRKNFLCELYTLCIGVIHRLLCYQKKCKIRFNYNWRNLWYSLVNLLKFLVNHEAELIKKFSILRLANQIVNIFNLFITFGDTFLPSLQSYDDLHYEIIRMHNVFDNLYSVAIKYSSMEGSSPCKNHATRLASSLINIKAIINHFNSKIEAWSIANQVASLTEDQVLEVVRNNYDSLTLILQDGLDQYENYASDKVCEITFFSQMIKKVIMKSRANQLDFTVQDQQTLMQDILTLNS